MDNKGLRALLVVHGFIATAAGIVLTVAPSLIPGVVGIRLEPSAYVLAYLLAGAEFGLAVLDGPSTSGQINQRRLPGPPRKVGTPTLTV